MGANEGQRNSIAVGKRWEKVHTTKYQKSYQDECALTTTKRGMLVVEIIVALIAVLGVVLPYLLQKNKELNLKIAEQKREAYASFLKNFTEIAVAVMHDEDVSGKDADL